jgi:hypothetical protein
LLLQIGRKQRQIQQLRNSRLGEPKPQRHRGPITHGGIGAFPRVNPAVNADIPNSSVRKSGVLKIIEVLEGRWAILVR